MSKNLALPGFLRKNLEPITEAWRDFAETLALPTTDYILRDHIHQILFYIADDIESPQSMKQQEKKSQGQNDAQKKSPAEIHALLRQDIGFNLVEMVSEYRALRAIVLKLWIKEKIALTDSDLLDLIRFNEAIDQLLTQSIASFMEKLQPKIDAA